MRPLLNCWIVAVWLWVASFGRGLLWLRRSLHFRGVIPHTGVGLDGGWRRLYIAEFIPKHAQLWSRDNLLVVFRGQVRVWELRAVRCRRFDSVKAARAYLKGKR